MLTTAIHRVALLPKDRKIKIGNWIFDAQVWQKEGCVSSWESILHHVEAPKGQTKGPFL